MSTTGLEFAVQLIFNRVSYTLPINCVAELLLINTCLFETRTYTVTSSVSVDAFDAFWCWLFVGREQPVPAVHAQECLILAAEFGIATLEPPYKGSAAPCMEACLLAEISLRFDEALGELEDRFRDLEAHVIRPGPHLVDAAQPAGLQGATSE
jgi:hypothetical protein